MRVICDLDGTVSDHNARVSFILGKNKNWDAYYNKLGEDPPIPGALHVLPKLIKMLGPSLVFLTGRSEEHRAATVEWLKRHFNIEPQIKRYPPLPTQPILIMRPTGDYRPAVVFKEEALLSLFGGIVPSPMNRRAFLIIDDDLRNTSMYSKYGIFLKAPECWDMFR